MVSVRGNGIFKQFSELNIIIVVADKARLCVQGTKEKCNDKSLKCFQFEFVAFAFAFKSGARNLESEHAS